MGIIAYGVLFGVMHSVQELASEAARASVAGLSDAEREQLARQQVTSALPGYGLLRADRLETDFIVDAADPRLYHIVLKYDPSYLGFEAFAGFAELGTTPFQRQAAVRRGGY